MKWQPQRCSGRRQDTLEQRNLFCSFFMLGITWSSSFLSFGPPKAAREWKAEPTNRSNAQIPHPESFWVYVCMGVYNTESKNPEKSMLLHFNCKWIFGKANILNLTSWWFGIFCCCCHFFFNVIFASVYKIRLFSPAMQTLLFAATFPAPRTVLGT